MPIELESYLGHLLQVGVIIQLFLLTSRELSGSNDRVPDSPSIQLVPCPIVNVFVDVLKTNTYRLLRPACRRRMKLLLDSRFLVVQSKLYA